MQKRTVQCGRPAGVTTFDAELAQAFGVAARSLRTARGIAQEMLTNLAVTTAEITDRNGELKALSYCKESLNQIQSLLCDSGYVDRPFEQGVGDILGEHVTAQIAKRSELHAFKVMPKRWVVERGFAWLEKNRRLWKNCERKLNTSLQFVHLAFLALLLKKLRTDSKGKH